MNDSLKKKTIHGVIWSSIDRFSSQGVSFIISIILARLLSPQDYGLIAMTSILISISQAFIDSGFSSAVVRKKNRTETDLSTAFYSNVIIGVICYSIVFVLSPSIANFFGELILSPIIKVMGSIFFLFSLCNIQQAILTIKVDFKTQTFISLISVSISGIIGIIMAYCDYGVWSLVYQQVLAAILRTILLWVLIKWRPAASFSMDSFNDLFSFGSKMLATGIMNSVFNNLYTIIIGRSFSSATLGFYSKADQLGQFSSVNITGVLQRVTFPILVIIQDDMPRFKKSYFKIMRLTSFVVFPLMVGLAALATPLVSILLTEKWTDTASLLQIICFALIWYPIYSLNLNVMEVKGRSDYLLKAEAINKIVSVIILIVSLPFGLFVICIGRICSSLISLFVSTYYSNKILEVKSSTIIKEILPALTISIIMYLCIHCTQYIVNTNWLKLLLGGGLGLIIYLFVSFAINTRDLKEMIQIFKRK